MPLTRKPKTTRMRTGAVLASIGDLPVTAKTEEAARRVDLFLAVGFDASAHIPPAGEEVHKRDLATLEGAGCRPSYVARSLQARSSRFVSFAISDIQELRFSLVARGQSLGNNSHPASSPRLDPSMVGRKPGSSGIAAGPSLNQLEGGAHYSVDGSYPDIVAPSGSPARDLVRDERRSNRTDNIASLRWAAPVS